MTNEQFMLRAFDLAKNGMGYVSPNPMVGCVIVHNENIIGEGWHKKYGQEHAEVNAVNSVENKDLISRSTFYISLEPCSYHGKTPACTDLLLQYKPSKVVIASRDPNPKVSGSGIKILEENGIEVVYGSLEEEAMFLNKRFFISVASKRPYIILKWAQTADGFIARNNFDSKWISNEFSRQLVHKWRTEEDAILVGSNTVKHDNPRLTSRNWQGDNPVRVILDSGLKLGQSCKVFEGEEKVYVFNSTENNIVKNQIRVKVSKENFLTEMLSELHRQNIGSIIIEGGAKTLGSFIDAGYWDEARIFTSESTYGDGIAAPVLNFDCYEEQNIMGDRLSIIYNPKSEILWQKN